MAMSFSLCGLVLRQLFLALMMQSLMMSVTSLLPCSSVWLLALEVLFILRRWMFWWVSLCAVLAQQVTLELICGLSLMQWLIALFFFYISPRFQDFSRLRLLLEGFLALRTRRLWVWKAVRLNSVRSSLLPCAFLLRVPMVCTSCSLLGLSSPVSLSTQKGLLFFSLACSDNAGLGSASCSCSVTCFSLEWCALKAILSCMACMNLTSSATAWELLGSRYLLFSMLRIWWWSLMTRLANLSSSAGSFWQNLMTRFWRMQRSESMQWSQDYSWKRVAKPEQIDINMIFKQPTTSNTHFLAIVQPHTHQLASRLFSSSFEDPSVLPSYSHAESESQNTSMSSLNLSSYCSSESSIMTSLSRQALSSFFSSQTCYPPTNKNYAFSSKQPSFLLVRWLSLPRWCLSRCVTILWEVLNSACSFLCCRQISLGVLSMRLPKCSRKDSQTSRPFIRYLRSSFAQAQRQQRLQSSLFLPCCLPLLAFLAVIWAPGIPYPTGMP